MYTEFCVHNRVDRPRSPQYHRYQGKTLAKVAEKAAFEGQSDVWLVRAYVNHYQHFSWAR